MALGLLWAVLAAMATNMIVGMLWYGPLFGKPWMKALGMDNLSKEEMKEMSKKAMPGYITGMVGAALGTTLLWFLFEWTTNAPDYAPMLKGVVLGFIAWFGFYVPPTLTARFFEEQKMIVWVIGAGYWGTLAMLYGLYVGIFA